MLENCSHATTEENGWGVEATQDDFERQLNEADVEAEASEVQRLLLEEARVPKKVLFDLRAGGSVCVDDARRIELKATHNEAHREAEASRGARNEANLGAHQLQVVREKLLSEGAIFVELRVEEDFFVLVE